MIRRVYANSAVANTEPAIGTTCNQPMLTPVWLLDPDNILKATNNQNKRTMAKNPLTETNKKRTTKVLFMAEK
jgi:hypothetical protein